MKVVGEDPEDKIDAFFCGQARVELPAAGGAAAGEGRSETAWDRWLVTLERRVA